MFSILLEGYPEVPLFEHNYRKNLSSLKGLHRREVQLFGIRDETFILSLAKTSTSKFLFCGPSILEKGSYKVLKTERSFIIHNSRIIHDSLKYIKWSKLEMLARNFKFKFRLKQTKIIDTAFKCSEEQRFRFEGKRGK